MEDGDYAKIEEELNKELDPKQAQEMGTLKQRQHAGSIDLIDLLIWLIWLIWLID